MTFKKIVLLPAFALLAISAFAGNGFDIKIKVNGIKDTMCYLGYYYGDKQYLKDSARANSKGEFSFQGKEALPGGIYLIVLPGKKYFEIVMDKDQKFSVNADFAKIEDYKTISSKGSDDNQYFFTYTAFITDHGRAIDQLRKKQTTLKESNDTLQANALKDTIAKLDKEVIDYKKNFIKEHPGNILAVIFKAMFDPEVPEPPILSNGRVDSTFRYRYFRDHYWDNIDFSDDRILRTPVYHNRLKTYIQTLTIQIPDSINKAGDYIIDKSRANKELLKYTIWFVTYTYETSEIMGMDAVFVHMAEKYYVTKEAYWVDDATLFKITDRAKSLKPLLLGKKAPNIVMPDTNGVYRSMYDIKSDYTIVIFWSPDCGHCKKAMPVLDSLYQVVKSKGVQVYAVCSETEMDKWKSYIKEHKLDWINVGDTLYVHGYKKLYDIQSTPIIYILDSKKEIIAKKIGVHQVGEILDNRFKNYPILHD